MSEVDTYNTNPVEHIDAEGITSKPVIDTESTKPEEPKVKDTISSEGVQSEEKKEEPKKEESKSQDEKKKSDEPFKLESIGPWIEDMFGKKAPLLPDNLKEGIVKYYPIISVVLAVISVFLLLAAIPILLLVIGVGAAVGSYKTYTIFDTFSAIVSIVIAIVSIYLTFRAYPKLKNREKAGWKLWYQNVWVGIIGSLLQLNIVGALISAIIWFYVLMQVKSKYTK